MGPARFDRLSSAFALRRSRRQALAAGGAGLAATGLLTGIRATAAQDATPAALPAAFPSDPHPSADSAMTHPEYLFVQPFDAGTWAPKPGEEGVYLLTLTGAAENTTFFSDRPERITGLAPTQPFLDGLGFTSENSPNAALVAQTESGVQDVLIVQIFDPVYDAGAGTLTYDARILADYGGRGLAHLAQQQTDYEFEASFGEGVYSSMIAPTAPTTASTGASTRAASPGKLLGLVELDVQSLRQLQRRATSSFGCTATPRRHPALRFVWLLGVSAARTRA